MKRFFSILVTIALCVSASAQTVKPLAYNMTNGTVMVSTNVTWSNSFKFSTNTVAAQVRTNLLLPAAWLTNTNAANFRTAVGLGSGDVVTFAAIYASTLNSEYAGMFEDEGGGEINVLQPLTFGTNAATTRGNLGLSLAALTNTSNVTMMRALSGSTNTNHPYSGSISVVGTNNTNTLTFSNGILQSVQ